MMAVAPSSRASVPVSRWCAMHRTFGRWVVDRAQNRTLTSGENIPGGFSGLVSTATTTWSNLAAAHSTTARWPRWKGSNEPGNMAVVIALGLDGVRAVASPRAVYDRSPWHLAPRESKVLIRW